MEAALNEHREHEQNLKATLMTAQKLADDIKAQAEQEAKRIVREAEGRSDLLLEKTQARLEDIQREIDGLKLKRRDVETTIEATIQTLRNTLEFVREQEARERDEQVLLHRPRLAEAPDAAARDRRSAADTPAASAPCHSSATVDGRRARRPWHPRSSETSAAIAPFAAASPSEAAASVVVKGDSEPSRAAGR